MVLAAVVIAGAGVAVDGIKDDATEGGSMRRVWVGTHSNLRHEMGHPKKTSFGLARRWDSGQRPCQGQVGYFTVNRQIGPFVTILDGD